MRKILCRALLCLCLVLALGPVHTAFAQDLDRIESYAVDVTPNTQDGSLRIQVTLEWTVLAEGPVSWVKIGVPNGSIRQEQALTDNIDRLSFDNSYMYVYFDRDYNDGETFRFSYSWVQEYMYALEGDTVSYDYTPGWFDEARVGQMTLTWHDPAGVDGAGSDGQTGGDHVLAQTDLAHGQQMSFTVHYDGWPTQLAQDGSRDSLPTDDDPSVNPGYDPGYDPDYQDDGLGLVGLVILLVVVFLIVRVAAASDGYRGGFGTHYVFVSGLWYPAGPDGRPRPGSHGTREKPKPPRSGGFGGGSRGGGFGEGRLRRRGTLRLRQQLRLCVRLRLCRRRPGRVQRQEPLWRGASGPGAYPGNGEIKKWRAPRRTPFLRYLCRQHHAAHVEGDLHVAEVMAGAVGHRWQALSCSCDAPSFFNVLLSYG